MWVNIKGPPYIPGIVSSGSYHTKKTAMEIYGWGTMRYNQILLTLAHYFSIKINTYFSQLIIIVIE